MTYITTETAPSGAETASLPRRMLGALSTALATSVLASRNRRTLREIALRDDYLLRDMGLTRADVDRALLAPLGDDPLKILLGKR